MIYSVKIAGPIEKYIKKAEELGYKKNQIISYCPFYIILYDIGNSKVYNILSHNCGHKEKTREEFFGEKMRKEIDLEILELLVYQVCDSLTSFSAYNVTSILRTRLPSHNIMHDDVRNCVLDYVQKNGLTESDNNTYKIYSKPKVNMTPCCQTTTPAPKVTKLQALLNQKNKVNKIDKVTVKPLGTESRISITEMARDFGDKVYVQRNKNNIIVSRFALKDSSLWSTNGEVRLRTGFTTQMAKVVKTKDCIKITPYYV